MSELLSLPVLETIVAALGLAMIYVVLWSGLSLLGHEDIRRSQNLKTVRVQRYPARRSKPR
jgi:hypothetical protein